MRRITAATLLPAAVLLVSACSSGSKSSTSSSSSAAAPSSASSAARSAPSGAAGSSQATGESAGAGGGSLSGSPATELTTDASAEVTPATLDAQTTAWFDALCTGIAPIKAVESAGLDTPGQDPASQWRAELNGLNTLSRAFSATSVTLATTQPPTFDNGIRFAELVTTGLGTAGGDLAKSAGTFAAVDPTDATALARAKTTLQTDLVSALSPLQSISGLDPAIQAATREIPSCKNLDV